MHRIILSLALLTLGSCSNFLHVVEINKRSIAARDNSYSYQNFDYIDFESILFGIEYSFQDKAIVEEPGRLTMRTPHKADRFEAMFLAYSSELGIGRESIVKDTSNGSFKPGYTFSVPNDGLYTINMEPVTIEVNTTPKHIDEIIPTSKKIFNAAKKAQIVPYVNPAAERSGMGHIHVGARTLRESPLYKNPLLLRNILVYYHQHPSLLYGFAEAYDIGDGSNIETFHNRNRQRAFERVVKEFDEWYTSTVARGGDTSQGLAYFLKFLNKYQPGDREFCHHYRIVNLQHLCKLDPDNLPLDEEGKFTLEHRGFRPQKNPETAHANAHLLLDLYEKLSDPSNLIPFQYISQSKFQRFAAASIIESDWEEVKKFISHDNKHSDDMIRETVEALTGKVFVNSKKIPNSKLIAAYSKKEDKGNAYELRIKSDFEPSVSVAGEDIDFEKVILNEESFWVSYIDVKDLGLSPEDFLSESSVFYRGSAIQTCSRVMKIFLN